MYYTDPKTMEKQDLFRHGNMLGFAVFLNIIVQFSSSTLLLYLYMVIRNKSFSEAGKALMTDIPFLLTMNVVLTLIVLTLPFLLSAFILNYKLNHLISLKRPVNTLPLIFIAFGIIAVGDLLTRLTSFLFSLIHLTPTGPDFGTPKDLSGLLFLLLTGAVAPAILEEFAFRGVILNALKKFGDWPAILISSGLFAMVHGNFVQIPFAFFAGIGLSLCYLRTKSIWPGVLVHFINNALSFILLYCYPSIPKGYEFLPDVGLLVLFGALGLTGFVLYYKKHGNVLTAEPVPSFFSTARRTLYLFRTPFILISVIVFFLLAVLALFSFEGML
ncbi:MAG: hypothetical protein BGN88_09230 [Clostridiales bacterium 43-6]|nr:MAG: hypothetical protein BGN88_09230 [Clostridiales bacterium 43-6]